MQFTVSGTGCYLLVPVWCGQKEYKFSFVIDGKPFTTVLLPIAETVEPDYFACLHISSGANPEIAASTSHAAVITADVDGKRFNQELFQFSPVRPECKKDDERPHIHFTADTGWINDPNGLVYKDGIYHLYFQYNPFNNSWQNMSWGHATSNDLLHWTQQDTVLYPEEDYFIFSGSGIVNEHEQLSLPKDALIFFYTLANKNKDGNERDFSQRYAFSTDGGNTLTKMAEPVIKTITSENRDPKVFWHEPTSSYICVLWLFDSTYCILRSNDLEHWEETQRLSFPPAWECPDLFKLECSETGEAKWVFWSADGYYLLGSFDGRTFSEEQAMQKTYRTPLAYAAQTYSNIPGKVISVAWLRTQNTDKIYRGAMALPREFSLVKKDDVYRIAHKPIAQYKALKKELLTKDIDGSAEIAVPDGAFELDISLSADESTKPSEQSIELSSNGGPFQNIFTYQAQSGTLVTNANFEAERKDFGFRAIKFGKTERLYCTFDGSLLEITGSDYTDIAHLECVSTLGTRLTIHGTCKVAVFTLS